MGGYIAGATRNILSRLPTGRREGKGVNEKRQGLFPSGRVYFAGNIDQGLAALEHPCDRVRKCLVGQWFAHTMHIAGASARFVQSQRPIPDASACTPSHIASISSFSKRACRVGY